MTWQSGEIYHRDRGLTIHGVLPRQHLDAWKTSSQLEFGYESGYSDQIDAKLGASKRDFGCLERLYKKEVDNNNSKQQQIK